MSRLMLFAVLSVAMLVGCDRAGDDGAQPGDASGSEVAAKAALTGAVDRSFKGTARPDLVVSDGAGVQLDLGAVEGPVLLNLWATWCAPCVVEMPQLDALADALEGEVKIITVSQDMRGAEVVAPFFAARGFARLEPWLDPEAELSAQFSEAGQLPLTILFDASGREVWRVAGGYEWDSASAITLVREGLAQP
jgi:thiol-disulfide isomerase/thioredoxin